MRRALADATGPEVDRHAAGRVLAVPVGSTEQQGPDLPLSTDTGIAVALVEEPTRRRPGAVSGARRAGRDRASDEPMPRLVAHGVREVGANGIIGDPAGAGAAEGRRLLEDGVDELVGVGDEVVASLDAAAARRA